MLTLLQRFKNATDSMEHALQLAARDRNRTLRSHAGNVLLVACHNNFRARLGLKFLHRRSSLSDDRARSFGRNKNGHHEDDSWRRVFRRNLLLLLLMPLLLLARLFDHALVN
jgi:hypothetical protein